MSSLSTSTNGNLVSYDWVLPNYSNCASQFSPYFSFPSNNGIQFRFFIYPFLTMPILGGTYMTVSVHLNSCDRDEVKLKHRMSIVNAKGEKCHTQESQAICKRDTYGATCSILKENLLNPVNGFLVINNLTYTLTLTIHCEVELINDRIVQSGLQANLEDLSSISQHYKSLLESGKHSDVVLSIGEKEFHAHKLVLSARSSVFAAMFDHSDTKEAQQGRVEIVDVEVEVFELFLRYLYTGQIYDLDQFASELLAVADMYQMDCLKSLCEHFLCSTLTIDNVSQLLIHADLYRADVLKSKCIDYITDYSEKVKTTEGWKAVSVKADLLVLLFDKLSIKNNSAYK